MVTSAKCLSYLTLEFYHTACGITECGLLASVKAFFVNMLSIQALREIEAQLSIPRFFGIPLGGSLNNSLILAFRTGIYERKRGFRLLMRLLIIRHWLYPHHTCENTLLPKGRIWVAWLHATTRLTDLVLPVLQALDKNRCAVLCGSPDVQPLVPTGNYNITWDQALNYPIKDWRKEYRRCRPELTRQLQSLCRQYNLPSGSFELLSLDLMISSQRVTGCIAFLKAAQPAVILTDYDRNDKWSCLVLAARLLRIPTVTLIHGVMNDDALGYAPLLADIVSCWGYLDRGKLLAAGVPAEKLLIGGCPRLSRDLSATAVQGRVRLALDQQMPIVMFFSSRERECLELAEAFCYSLEQTDFLLGVVRLHPSENIKFYETIIQRHPRVFFFESQASTLDESLACANLVVVQNSGVGSDALVKRRPVVVLDFETKPSGHGGDLIKLAGCPHARTSDELTTILSRFFHDETYRRQLALTAEDFVKDFCCAYGQDSARRIADIVISHASARQESLNPTSKAI